MDAPTYFEFMEALMSGRLWERPLERIEWVPPEVPEEMLW